MYNDESPLPGGRLMVDSPTIPLPEIGGCFIRVFHTVAMV